MAATATARRAAARRATATRRAAGAPVRGGRAATAASPRRTTAARNGRPRTATPRRRGVTPAAGLLIPVAVGARTATAVGGLADSGLVFRLTRGRLWILAIGLLLVGIVALNVLQLSFSAEASRMASQADAIEREASALRAGLAADASAEKLEREAGELGLAVPPTDAIYYLEPADRDAEQAARRLRDGELSDLGW